MGRGRWTRGQAGDLSTAWDGRVAASRIQPQSGKGRPHAHPSGNKSQQISCSAAACVHSITSVARIRMEGGIVMPRCLAVFRLSTRSKVVGCSIGRSPGLAPLRIRST